MDTIIIWLFVISVAFLALGRLSTYRKEQAEKSKEKWDQKRRKENILEPNCASN
jgi:hypothetical protein